MRARGEHAARACGEGMRRGRAVAARARGEGARWRRGRAVRSSGEGAQAVLVEASKRTLGGAAPAKLGLGAQ